MASGSGHQISRRTVMQLMSAGAIGPLLASGSPKSKTRRSTLHMRARLDVRSFGATGDGTTSDTNAIQSAVEEASRHGAVLTFPPGRYVSGTLHLRSNVSLVIAEGATLVASPNDNDFPVARPDYGDTVDELETVNASFALLAGKNLSNLNISGRGTIDMNRSAYGGPKGIGLRECSDLVIESLTLRNAPDRNIELMGCNGVSISAVKILNGYSDGIDPDCCTNVSISRCFVDSFDDSIVIKSSFALGRRVDSSNITVDSCHVRSSCNGLKIGTETEGDVTGVRFSNCLVSRRPSPGIPESLAEHGGVAIESVDGGHVSEVSVSDVVLEDIAGPLFVRLGNRGRAQAVPTPGTMSDITFSNVSATGASITASITGLPGYPVSNLTLSNVNLSYSRSVRVAPGLSVPELAAAYPYVAMFGTLPSAGLYARHVEDLNLSQVKLSQQTSDPRPGLVIDDGESVSLDDLELVGSRSPFIWLNDVRGGEVEFPVDSPLNPSNVRLTGGSAGVVFSRA
ncbi:MAG TPA: glycosyl hydrolase family 28 protein [Acidimicrobiales bacterium]|nr:glycosyl hydrolase family 28 protein [Acidimicrobiales bacterium]